MTRLSRIVVFGFPHCVTHGAISSMDVLHSEAERREFLWLLREEIARHGVIFLVWWLMTNRVRFVAVPHQETTRAWSFDAAQRKDERMKNYAARVRCHLFQGRFSSCVLDASHLNACMRSEQPNPVRPVVRP